MHPQQLRHTYKQCVTETDRRAAEAHRTEHQFRQLAKELEAFFRARDAYTMARHLKDTSLISRHKSGDLVY